MNLNSAIPLFSSQQRRQHFKEVDQKWLKEKLKEGGSIATHRHPIEFFTSDIAMFINDALIAVYRTIPPEGWILPGGCPESFEELLDPKRVGEREFSEEILLLNKRERIVYVVFPHYEKIVRENMKKWGVDDYKIIHLSPKPISLKPQGTKIVLFFQRKEITLRVPWFIATEIGTIVIIRAFSVELPGVDLFDCEVDAQENLLNRPVGLFKGGELMKMFVGGRQVLPHKWATELHRSFAGQ